MSSFHLYPTQSFPVEAFSLRSSDVSPWQPQGLPHKELAVILVKSGSMSLEAKGEDLVLNAGQGIFINQDVPFSIHYQADQAFKAHCLLFLPSIIFGAEENELAEKYLQGVLASPNAATLVLEKGKRDLYELLLLSRHILLSCQSCHIGYELDVKAMLCRFWKRLLSLAVLPEETEGKPPSHSDNVRIKIAVDYIEENYAKPLTLDSIARSIHTSNSECCRCFKRTLGVTPFEYLLRLRIMKVAQALRTEKAAKETISELAASVGFNSPSYFNKKFKQYLHCTPKEYRQEYFREKGDYPADPMGKL